MSPNKGLRETGRIPQGPGSLLTGLLPSVGGGLRGEEGKIGPMGRPAVSPGLGPATAAPVSPSQADDPDDAAVPNLSAVVEGWIRTTTDIYCTGIEYS
jgi:hypothetical protein